MSKIAEIVCKEVDRQGVIPFADFMRLALYCPKYGYYEQLAGRIGRAGDFYTNVSVGGLFGELLAFRFAEWLDGLPRGGYQLVEAGAHDGQLARDILGWMRKYRPALLTSVQYWIVEPSPQRRACQQETLEDFAGDVHWFDSLASLPTQGVRGVIFSNELLDAMPVHRLGWDAAARRWFEWGVALAGTDASCSYLWKRIPREVGHFTAELSGAGLEFPGELSAVLPDGFTIEISPEAAAWWREAAKKLTEGKLLTIDYGLTAEQFVIPERRVGTLRGYQHHHSTADALADVGEQDLTAHVNFTQLQRAGEGAGLSTEGLFSQETFLTKIAAATWESNSNFGEWTADRRRQFQTLTHPQHLGRPFSVLLQSRGRDT
jgi:SAM-dependent MidA family methyltransferase